MSGIKILLILFLFSSFFSFLPGQARAADPITKYSEGPPVGCDIKDYVDNVKLPTLMPSGPYAAITVNFNPNADKTLEYRVKIFQGAGTDPKRSQDIKLTSGLNPVFLVGPLTQTGTYEIQLVHKIPGIVVPGTLDEKTVCNLGKVVVYNQSIYQSECQLTMSTNIKKGDPITIKVDSKTVPNIKYILRIFRQGEVPKEVQFSGNIVIWENNLRYDTILRDSIFNKDLTSPSETVTIDSNKYLNNTFVALAYAYSSQHDFWNGWIPSTYTCAQNTFAISNSSTTPPETTESKGVPVPPKSGSGNTVYDCADPSKCTSAVGQLCRISNGHWVETKVEKHQTLYEDIQTTPREILDVKDVGIRTAIGCVPTNPVELIKGLTRFFIGIGGGVALLLMIFGAIQMMTSGGNPESLKGGRERFTSAALGLVFVIFSIALLQIIGVDILNLPGFNP